MEKYIIIYEYYETSTGKIEEDHVIFETDKGLPALDEKVNTLVMENGEYIEDFKLIFTGQISNEFVYKPYERIISYRIREYK